MIPRASIILMAICSTLGCTDKGDSGDPGEEAPCIVLTSGPWVLNGTSLGHDMFGTLAFDEESCSFEFSDWNMAMDIATGGVIEGDTLTFVGDEAERD